MTNKYETDKFLQQITKYIESNTRSLNTLGVISNLCKCTIDVNDDTLKMFQELCKIVINDNDMDHIRMMINCIGNLIKYNSTNILHSMSLEIISKVFELSIKNSRLDSCIFRTSAILLASLEKNHPINNVFHNMIMNILNILYYHSNNRSQYESESDSSSIKYPNVPSDLLNSFRLLNILASKYSTMFYSYWKYFLPNSTNSWSLFMLDHDIISQFVYESIYIILSNNIKALKIADPNVKSSFVCLSERLSRFIISIHDHIYQNLNSSQYVMKFKLKIVLLIVKFVRIDLFPSYIIDKTLLLEKYLSIDHQDAILIEDLYYHLFIHIIKMEFSSNSLNELFNTWINDIHYICNKKRIINLSLLSQIQNSNNSWIWNSFNNVQLARQDEYDIEYVQSIIQLFTGMSFNNNDKILISKATIHITCILKWLVHRNENDILVDQCIRFLTNITCPDNNNEHIIDELCIILKNYSSNHILIQDTFGLLSDILHSCPSIFSGNWSLELAISIYAIEDIYSNGGLGFVANLIEVNNHLKHSSFLETLLSMTIQMLFITYRERESKSKRVYCIVHCLRIISLLISLLARSISIFKPFQAFIAVVIEIMNDGQIGHKIKWNAATALNRIVSTDDIDPNIRDLLFGYLYSEELLVTITKLIKSNQNFKVKIQSVDVLYNGLPWISDNWKKSIHNIISNEVCIDDPLSIEYWKKIKLLSNSIDAL